MAVALAFAGGASVDGCTLGPALAPPASDPPTFDFRTDSYGWIAGFADIRVGQEDAIGFLADYRLLPAPLAGSALYQSGSNLSDDLCMWFAGRADGFEPGADYAIGFEVGIASHIGFGCDIGIGQSTTLKVGVASYQPDRVEVAGHWRMNIDKGSPEGDGTQALTVGDIRNALPGCISVNAPWGERALYSGSREILVQAPGDGALWFFVITDSTWEAWYEVFVTYLDVHIRRTALEGPLGSLRQ